MFSMFLSIFWVCCTVCTLTVKAFFMRLTLAEVKKAQIDTTEHLRNARAGNKWMFVSSIVGFVILLSLYALGVLKVWVVIIEAVAFVLCVILNIVFIKKLRKQAR